MSNADIIGVLSRGAPRTSIRVVCVGDTCYELLNPETSIEWDNDTPVKITLCGKCMDGEYRCFERTLLWSGGNLESISPWRQKQ